MAKCVNRKIHKDCPFTEEEIALFHDMLYSINTGNHCMNPAPVLWVGWSQLSEQYQADTGPSFETLLREENEQLRNQLEELRKQIKQASSAYS